MHRLWQIIGIVSFWITFPGIAFFLSRSERTRIAIVSSGKIVVVKGWLGNGKWNLPGGGLHKGETPLNGVLREVLEETGIHLPAGRVRRLTTEAYRYHGMHFPCHYFFVELTNLLPLEPQQAFEIIDVMWVSQERMTRKNSNPDVMRLIHY